MNLITHYQCPVCHSNNIKKALTAKDHTVSKEEFEVWHCNNCTVRFTQKIPPIEEIGIYYQTESYVSHSDVKKNIIDNLYHFIRNYTLRIKKNLVQTASRKSKGVLLDVGAGTGYFAAYMQKAGWMVTALEPDATARENANVKRGINLQDSKDIYHLPPETFDVITLWHVLEHVHELPEYLQIFYKTLKQSGVLIIAVPNYTSYDAQYYKQHWAAYDVPRHLYHFSPESMQMLLQQHRFKIKNHKPMWFDSFYVSLLSEKYLTGKNNFLRACWNGFISNIKALGDTKKCSSVIYIAEKETELL